MKLFIAFILIIGFTGMATFGVFAMSHLSEQGHAQGCAASAISGLVCVKGTSGFDFAAFHLNTFRNIFAASFKNSVSMVLLLALGALLLGYSALFKVRQSYLAKRSWWQFLTPLFFSQKQELISWLAFHESSPTII